MRMATREPLCSHSWVPSQKFHWKCSLFFESNRKVILFPSPKKLHKQIVSVFVFTPSAYGLFFLRCCRFVFVIILTMNGVAVRAVLLSLEPFSATTTAPSTCSHTTETKRRYDCVEFSQHSMWSSNFCVCRFRWSKRKMDIRLLIMCSYYFYLKL